jgi:magnesium transporter
MKTGQLTDVSRKLGSQASEVTRVHSVYVVNNNNVLLGRLSLKDLISCKS